MNQQGQNFIRPSARRWIGSIVRALAKRHRISVAQIAQNCAIQHSVIHDTMNGDTMITDFFFLYYLNEIMKGMEVLGVTADVAKLNVWGMGVILNLIASPSKAKETIDVLRTWTAG